MKTTSKVILIGVTAALVCAGTLPVISAAPTPQYQIYDIGVVDVGDSFSQGLGVSPEGIAVGRSIRNDGSHGFTWTLKGGIVGLPNLAGRSYCVSNSANDSGIVVGTGATTAFGSGRLPVVWQNGVVSQLPLPVGQTLGDADSVNASNVAVGSVNAGSDQRGVIYNGGSATIITQTTTNGSFFFTAFGINDSGRIVARASIRKTQHATWGLFMILGRAWPLKLAHCQATTERSLSV